MDPGVGGRPPYYRLRTESAGSDWTISSVPSTGTELTGLSTVSRRSSVDSLSSRDIEVASSQSVSSMGSTRSLSASLGSLEMARERNLRAIREENEPMIDQRSGDGKSGMDITKKIKKVADFAKERASESKQRKIKEWEERARERLSGGSGSTRDHEASTSVTESWKIPIRRNKDDNIALRLLQVHKHRMELRREKTEREELAREAEEAEIAELRAFALEASQWVDEPRTGDTTPLPPYRGDHVLPDDLYESLSFKRLLDRMESDGETMAVKENIYESIDSPPRRETAGSRSQKCCSGGRTKREA